LTAALGRKTIIGVFEALEPAIRAGQTCAVALTLGLALLLAEPHPNSKVPMVGVGH